jgi:hypothetical protein
MIRLRFVLTLALTVVIVLGAFGVRHWRSEQDLRRMESARIALEQLVLPSGVTDGNMQGGIVITCVNDADRRCLQSAELPNKAGPLLGKAIHATYDECTDWNSNVGVPCIEIGALKGVEVSATVTPHGYYAVGGRYPPGAIRGTGHSYFLGSNIRLRVVPKT